MTSGFAIAHDGHDMQPMNSSTEMDVDMMNMPNMDHSSMNHSMMDHTQQKDQSSIKSQAKQDLSDLTAQDHQGHDHRKEHGAQIYAMTTFDNKWLLDDKGQGTLKSKLETRIGTDENKIFIQLDTTKRESQNADLDAKVLYSRMISDFWDAQVGVRYRSEKVERDDHQKMTDDQWDGVIGLHGLAWDFIED